MLTLTLLAACQPDETPTPTPTTEVPSVSESSATGSTEDAAPSPDVPKPSDVQAPKPPENIRVDDGEGAIAAAGYLLSLYGYMQVTGDTGQWMAMSRPDCSLCSTSREVVENIHRNGGWVETDGLSFDLATASVALPDPEYDNYLVELPVAQEAGTIYYGDGRSATTEAAEPRPLLVGLIYANGRFLVGDIR